MKIGSERNIEKFVKIQNYRKILEIKKSSGTSTLLPKIVIKKIHMKTLHNPKPDKAKARLPTKVNADRRHKKCQIKLKNMQALTIWPRKYFI